MKCVKKVISALLLACCATTFAQKGTTMKLWPNAPEVVSSDEKDEAEVTVYLPDAKKATGRAVVCCPGGGYQHLAMDHEGHQWAAFFNTQGIALIVLKYRMPHGNRLVPISDAEEAMKLVRRNAAEWHINPNDVGIMGFSAGGHLSSVISTMSPYEVRPNFSILFYPVISMDERVSHKWSCINFLGREGYKDPKLIGQYSTQNAVRSHLTPPACIISANDDRLVPVVTNGIQYYSAMRNAGNECSLFIYPSGDHGFGFGTWFKYHDQLLQDLGNWLKSIPAPKEDAIRVACIGNSITDGFGIDMRAKYGYPAQLQGMLGDGYWVKNFGVSARTMLNKGDFPYMNEMAWKDALAFKPDVVVIKLGTNDSKPENWQYGSEFRQDLEQMIKTLRPDLAQPAKKGKKTKAAAQPVGPKILLCTPIPAFKPSWNINDKVITDEIIPIQQEVAKQYGLQVIDLHTLMLNDGDKVVDDGIHPNEKGAKKMAEIIAAAIK